MSWLVLSRWLPWVVGVLIVILLLSFGNVCLAQRSSDTMRVEINAISGMQYDLVRFSVRPGTFVKVILKNTDEMEHNLVIGKTGSRDKIVTEALKLAQDGPSLGYIPPIPEILWSVALLKAGDIDSISFRAPRNTGAYPYVCTFPGHGSVMFGAMYVTNGVMPSLIVDENVPLHRRNGGEEMLDVRQMTGHPYRPNPPYLYRVLMPDTGPAAIAVCLPHEINYCWDAGSCRLRYAWSGEFLDLMDYWTVKGELHAKA
ncbi:MAG: hypothetical protein IPL46_24420 [Saprospiraceae bacterium]|nr:hypothetical protein [Saprospiraceae bacterium]